MIKLAHLSDCHIAPLPCVKPSQLLNKRFTGYLNWRRHRSHVHNRSILDDLCEDIKNQTPDHIALTGDLVNLGLPDEFIQAQSWLEEFGSPDWISLTPGNHDSYLNMKDDIGMQRWAPYMSSDMKGKGLLKDTTNPFPFIRFLENHIAVIGLSSSIPTRPFMATGTLGDHQIRILKDILKELKKQNVFSIILIHHPPLHHLTKPRRALTDADKLEPVLKQMGDGIILHGHNHLNSIFNLETESGIIPIIGVPSASCGKKGKEPLARYNLLHIDNKHGEWKCTMTGRGYEDLDEGIKELDTTTLI